MIKVFNRSGRLALLAAFAFTLAMGNVQAQEPSVDGEERVVISLNTDPTRDAEPACVALQIGINLLLDSVPVGDNTVMVIPADEVKLFLTIGGVELVNPDNNIYKRAKPKAVCDTPNGPKTATLQQLLGRFVSLGGEVVLCPLCADRRGITDPTFGTIANAEEIHNLFLRADKVATF